MSNPRSSHGVERYRWFWPSHGKRQVEVKRQLGAGRAKHHLKVSWGQSWCCGKARLSQKITVMYGIREPRNPLSGAPDMYLIYCFVEYDSTTIPLINWFIVKLVSLSWMSKNKKMEGVPFEDNYTHEIFMFWTIYFKIVDNQGLKV